MANGSFGLSGLPTAPTTVGSAPNNALTPVSVAVNSTAGFQSGDLVYNFGGDIAPVPGNFASTGTFPITDTNTTYAQNVTSGEMMPSPVTGGYNFRSGDTIAKLTNGNIVIVYLRNHPSSTNYPYFKIIDENGTVIVAETAITGGANFSTYGVITVAALTGGGFAAAWLDGASSTGVWTAVYTNTGTVTRASTLDTGAGYPTYQSMIQIAPRPDGSWILAVMVSATMWHKVFNAAGNQVYAWTNVGSNQASSYYFRYVVRSDNSFIFMQMNAGGTLDYTVYSATNTVSKARATLTSTASVNAQMWGGATLLASDTTLVTFGTTTSLYYVTINSSNTASATTQYTFVTGSNYYWARPITLANGNYLLGYMSISNANGGYVLQYAVLNSSHVLQSPAGGNTLTGFTTNTVSVPASAVETTNYYHFINTPCNDQVTQNNGWTSSSPLNMVWARISPTTYLPTKANTTTVSIGNTAAQAVSGYARSGSTPTTASFFAATTGTISTSSTAGSLLVAQTTIEADTVIAIDTATLSNGTALILYRLSSGLAPLKLAVITPSGVLSATYTVVANTYTSGVLVDYNMQFRLAVLTDGKIAVSYMNSAGSGALLILSSTYAVLSTLTLTNISVNTQAGSMSLAALTNARFVLTYINSSNNRVEYQVYNSSLTQLVANTIVGTTTSTNYLPSVAATQSGFIISYYYTTGSAYYYISYLETSTNAFTDGGTSGQFNAGTANFIANKMITGPNGSIYSLSLFGTAGDGRIGTSQGQMSGAAVFTSVTPNFGVSNNGSQAPTLAVTPGTNNVVAVYFGSATTINSITYNASGRYAVTGLITITLSLPATAALTVMSACGLVGNSVLLALRNSSNHLTYCIYNPSAVTYTTPLTAGVTPSNTTAIGLSNGFSLVGVSSTDAPANGQGTVVINGPAQLSSSYPSTTAGQSFDFGNPVTFGAAGTISGRNVNLIGNV